MIVPAHHRAACQPGIIRKQQLGILTTMIDAHQLFIIDKIKTSKTWKILASYSAHPIPRGFFLLLYYSPM